MVDVVARVRRATACTTARHTECVIRAPLPYALRCHGRRRTRGAARAGRDRASPVTWTARPGWRSRRPRPAATARLVWSLELREPWLAAIRSRRASGPDVGARPGRSAAVCASSSRVALSDAARPADHHADERTERDVIGDLRRQRQGTDVGPAAAEHAEVEAGDERGRRGAPHTTVRRRGRTTASTTPQPREIAPWAATPAAARALGGASSAMSSVPAARTASKGERPVATACRVEGAPLNTAATAPARRPTRRSDVSIDDNDADHDSRGAAVPVLLPDQPLTSLDEYIDGFEGGQGLVRCRELGPDGIVDDDRALGAARPRGRRLPDRAQVGVDPGRRSRGRRPLRGRQRRRGRAGDVQGPDAHAPEPVPGRRRARDLGGDRRRGRCLPRRQGVVRARDRSAVARPRAR